MKNKYKKEWFTQIFIEPPQPKQNDLKISIVTALALTREDAILDGLDHLYSLGFFSDYPALTSQINGKRIRLKQFNIGNNGSLTETIYQAPEPFTEQTEAKAMKRFSQYAETLKESPSHLKARLKRKT